MVKKKQKLQKTQNQSNNDKLKILLSKIFSKQFIFIGISLLLFYYFLISDKFQQKSEAKSLSPGYKVIKKYQRNLSDRHYTQGFKFLNPEILIESGGLYKQSEIHYINSTTMEILNRTKNEDQYFGEGCAVIFNQSGQQEIHQLTWQEKIIFVYDNSLNLIKTFNQPKEMRQGWGLASGYDKKKQKYYLLATDGTNKIFFINPKNWKIFKTLSIVNSQGQPIMYLNDLELIGDKILINVYMTTFILELDLHTGKLIKQFNFSEQKKEIFTIFQELNLDEQHCLNGIAYDQQNERVLITGKKWPLVYEVQFDLI